MPDDPAEEIRKLAARVERVEQQCEALAASPGPAARLRRSFQTLWVGGTLGAFFAAVIVTIPDAWRELGWPVSFEKTLDRVLRYGYMVWFLVYFFVSNLLNEHEQQPEPEDVWFDIAQSAAALATAWALGFLSPSDPLQRQPIARGVLIANGAVLVICALSLYLFRTDHDGANAHRWWGFGVTAAAVVLWRPLRSMPLAPLVLGAASLAVLGLLLWTYGRARLQSLGIVKPPRPQQS